MHDYRFPSLFPYCLWDGAASIVRHPDPKSYCRPTLGTGDSRDPALHQYEYPMHVWGRWAEEGGLDFFCPRGIISNILVLVDNIYNNIYAIASKSSFPFIPVLHAWHTPPLHPPNPFPFTPSALHLQPPRSWPASPWAPPSSASHGALRSRVRASTSSSSPRPSLSCDHRSPPPTSHFPHGATGTDFWGDRVCPFFENQLCCGALDGHLFRNVLSDLSYSVQCGGWLL